MIYCESTVYGCLTGGGWVLNIVRSLHMGILLEVGGCNIL